MRRSCSFAITAIATVVLAACGGKPSIASKSATAYRDAVAQGKDVSAGGHTHGGHTHEQAAPIASSEPTVMDHGSMPGMVMAKNSTAMPNMGHGRMQSGTTETMNMQHGSMAGMNMEGGSMTGMDHSQPRHGTSQAMASMPGMKDGAGQTMANMPGMQHGAAAPAPVIAAAPSSSSGISQLNPSSTLQPDAFDQPAPAAVSEASKARSGRSGGMASPPAKSQSAPHVHPPSGGDQQ